MVWKSGMKETAEKTSAAERGLQALGLGGILEAAKAMASAGVLERLVKALDEMETVIHVQKILYEQERERNPTLPSYDDIIFALRASKSHSGPSDGGPGQSPGLRLVDQS